MLLQVSGLKKKYSTKKKEVSALDGVSFEMEKGDFVAVNGPSGCGKTTLLLISGGLLYPDEGTVRMNGRDLYNISSGERDKVRAQSMGFVFQQFYLIPYLNILENILVPTVGLNSNPDLYRKRAEELIRQLNLEHRINHKSGELSTGERQRVAMARALINDPEILFADEPTGNLDDENADVVLEYIENFKRMGKAILLVTHDRRIGQHADKIYRMNGGKFIQ